MTLLLPTGEQLTISANGYSATVCEVGATLRRLTVAGRDLVAPFAEDAAPSGSQGQQLLPWPNRIRDGRYPWGGVTQQLAITEVARNTALHGLVAWVPWHTVEHTDSRVVQRVVVYEQPGWPGVLEAHVTHEVAEDGLTVTVRATNRGRTAIPFGYAAHPYLRTQEDRIDEVSVSLPAASFLAVDPERLLPREITTVEGTANDLRGGSPLGSVQLDTAFTDITTEEGRWKVRLANGDYETVLWAEERFGWIQVFTGPDRDLLAVEPMTCGPDAFNEGPTHGDVIVLESGQEFEGRWGLRGR